MNITALAQTVSERSKPMPTLFIRTLIVYLFMFAVIRLMGKRQISDMQPFDLAVTLLIANLASLPMGDPSTPLLYGVIPMSALFILHKLVAKASLKSEGIRRFVCGSPLVVIARGVVREDVMRAANYSLNDLYEQLRLKDVFAVSTVEYAILETNGSLSVLLKGPFQQPNNEKLQLESDRASPAVMLIMDGKLHRQALREAGITEKKLLELLAAHGISSVRECFFAQLDSAGMLHAQKKRRKGFEAEAVFIDTKRRPLGKEEKDEHKQ